jgi:hypothetical protein
VARDRTWFTDNYIPFNSWVRDGSGNYVEVIGAGTVKLRTQKMPGLLGVTGHSQIWLTNVLHCPMMTCNIIGSPITEDYLITKFPFSVASERARNVGGYINNYQSQDSPELGYFKPVISHYSLCELALTPPPEGPRVGPSPFERGKEYAIRARWTYDERERLKRVVADIDTWGPDCLRSEEEQWLKFHDGDEERFLANRGLNIDVDEDREEGRAILRDIIAGKKPWN